MKNWLDKFETYKKFTGWLTFQKIKFQFLPIVKAMTTHSPLLNFSKLNFCEKCLGIFVAMVKAQKRSIFNCFRRQLNIVYDQRRKSTNKMSPKWINIIFIFPHQTIFGLLEVAEHKMCIKDNGMWWNWGLETFHIFLLCARL